MNATSSPQNGVGPVPSEADRRRRRLWLDEAEATLRERGFEVTPDVRADLAYYYDEERPQEWRQAERDERELEDREDRELAALMDRLRERHT